MQLTTDQQTALDKIKDFLNKESRDPNDSFFTLMGFAGSGKTSLVPYIAKEFKGTIYGVAPTNKAVKVLREKGGGHFDETLTIHKLLGVSASIDDEKKVFKKIRDSSIEEESLIIVDEASMLHAYLFKILGTEAMERDCKVIFVGDPAQLPPVEEDGASKLSPVFSIRHKFQMTEVVRIKGQNPIINYVTPLRNNLESPLCPFERKDAFNETGGIWFYSKYPDFEKKFLDEFYSLKGKPEIQETKIIAWTNKEVNTLNQIVRTHLYPEQIDEQYIIGEYLVARSPVLKFQAARDSEVVIHTGEEVRILAADPYMHQGIQMFKLNVEKEDEETYDIVVLDKNHEREWKAYLEERAKVARESKDKKSAWKNFFLVKESVADVRYCFSLTAHQSQGSTFRNVYIQEPDIMRNPNLKESNQCRYTAYTRASNQVHVYY